MAENDRKVRLLIPGVRSQAMDFNAGETIRQFAERVSSDMLPLSRVETFYVNQQAVAADYELQDGDIISGAPKLKGGR